MAKYLLSKSSFIRGCQCMKSLYLYKYHYKLKDPISKEQQAKFDRGHKVGELAQQLFPGGIDVKPPTPFQYDKSIAQTSDLISKNQMVIYEAAFQFNEAMCASDILVKTENGWVIYEVKSSLAISDTYILDAALQYYIIKNCGLQIADISIIYAKEAYNPNEEMDLKSYFIFESVMERILDLQTFIEEQINDEKYHLINKIKPDVAMGEQCNKPYPCDFIGYCKREAATLCFDF